MALNCSKLVFLFGNSRQEVTPTMELHASIFETCRPQLSTVHRSNFINPTEMKGVLIPASSNGGLLNARLF